MPPFMDFKKEIMSMFESIVPKYCDKCGNKLLESELEIIRSDAEKMIAKIGCNSCKNSYIFHIILDDLGRVGIGKSPFKSEVSNAELKLYSSLGKIEDEELLDTVIAISEIKTLSDFEKIFKKVKAK